MKVTLSTLLLVTTAVGYSQQFLSGALLTNQITYDKFGTIPLPIASTIPTVKDLSHKMPPAGNQYPQNSCVTWAD